MPNWLLTSAYPAWTTVSTITTYADTNSGWMPTNGCTLKIQIDVIVWPGVTYRELLSADNTDNIWRWSFWWKYNCQFYSMTLSNNQIYIFAFCYRLLSIYIYIYIEWWKSVHCYHNMHIIVMLYCSPLATCCQVVA
jgi:hypothetical protein